MERLEAVIKKQNANNTIIVITISLIFDNGSHDVKAVFNYLNTFRDFDVTYIVLENGWYKGDVLQSSDLEAMKGQVPPEKINYFSSVINDSKEEFERRTKEIEDKMS